MRKARARNKARYIQFLVEALEPRTLLSATGQMMGDLSSMVAVPAVAQPAKGPPGKPPPSTSYTPAQIRAAYGIPDSYTGAGQTIAIIDAYADPNVAADLNTFDAAYFGGAGVAPNPKLTVHPMASAISGNTGWGLETALDVEWAYAIAPDANIILVEAPSNSYTDLMAAVDYANSIKVNVVSMSWGSSEFSGETGYDSHFLVGAGITYVASSGDSGGVVSWPAVSPNVVGVGGTTATINDNNTITNETGWSDSGGGVSAYEAKPTYQSGVTQSKTKRTSPDVAYNADPSTGYRVYDTYGYGGWITVGGTSAGAPQWAALIALADQARASSLLSSLSSADTLSALYASAGNFNDITSGTAGRNKAGTGYDLVTGLGSPMAGAVISSLMGWSSASAPLAGATYSSVDAPADPAIGLVELASSVSGTAASATAAANPSEVATAAGNASGGLALELQAIRPVTSGGVRQQSGAALSATSMAAANGQEATATADALDLLADPLELSLRPDVA